MTNTTDAHMPPQAIPPDDDPVWGNTWNPDTNEWAPSSHQHSTFGVAEPSHGDELDADPESYQYGRYEPEDAGAGPDVRKNLLTDVIDRGSIPVPVQRVEHVVRTEEVSSALIRLRTVAVVGNATPTVLLEENPARKRAIIHVLTTPNTAILIAPLHQGGLPALTAVPTIPGAFWVLQTNDQSMEVKTQAGLECVGITASSLCLVMVQEELNALNPGLV